MALPGVTTVLKDRFYTLSRTNIPQGPKVLAIASRDTADGTGDVNDYDPYRALNEQDVVTAFGEGSGCHRAYLELTAGGAARPYIVALPKGITDADLNSLTAVTVDGDGTDHDHGSHIPLDMAFEAAETEQPDIVALWGRGGHSTDWENPATAGNDLPIGFYADNSTVAANSMAKRVADKCKTLTERSHPCFGVIGTAPYIGTGANARESIVASEIASHVEFAGLTDYNDTDNFGDNGPYVSVVATEMTTLGYDAEFGYANGACYYAGYISQLPVARSTTGKVLFNVDALRYNPTRSQQEAMIALGLVPVALDFNRTPTFVDGQTFGAATSDYTRLTTLRIIFDAVLRVRKTAQGFVGEAATLQQQNALETAVSADLRNMQQIGSLLSADFNVTYQADANRAIIDLVLQPAFELRNIEIRVSVQL